MRILVLSLLLLTAACSQSEPAEPQPALSFNVQGGTFEWTVANGGKGGLLLGRTTEDGAVQPVLVITCDGLRRGGLQARLFTADPGPLPLELTAGDAVMSVPTRRGLVGSQPTLEGEGAMPEGWAEALGAASVLKLRYSDQGIEVQGPGPEKAGAFGAHCRELDARSG